MNRLVQYEHQIKSSFWKAADFDYLVRRLHAEGFQGAGRRTADFQVTAVRRTGLQRTSFAIKDGILVEHWDVLQDEATKEQSKSGLPMFGDTFGK
jgi:hypothetical protein